MKLNARKPRIFYKYQNTGDTKRMKPDDLQIQLIVNDNFTEEWNCKSFVEFSTEHTNIAFKFHNKLTKTLKDTRKTIVHSIPFANVEHLAEFNFTVHVAAELPSNWRSVEATGFVGLKNEGATCYINSLLQSLFATNKFREIIYHAPVDTDDAKESFIYALKYIFYAMQSKSLQEVRTLKLIESLNWPPMTTSDQQDVEEFSRKLMDEINEYLKGTQFEDSLSDLFVGQVKITIEVLGCIKFHLENFWNLQLTVHDNDDIDQAIKTYLAEETVDDYEFNDMRTTARQKREFTVLPPVLNIQLMRFRYDPRASRSTKSNKRFKFDAELVLGESNVYVLHSVLVHSGSVNSGHYIVFVNPMCDGNWYKFDDEVVTKCLPEDAIEKNYGNRGESSAYLLVYINMSAIPEILKPVDISEVPHGAFLNDDIEKERNQLSWLDERFEVILFTDERLMNSKWKRNAKLFDVSRKDSYVKLYVERTKNVGYLRKAIENAFAINPAEAKYTLYKIINNENLMEWPEINECDKPLTAIVDENRYRITCYVHMPLAEFTPPEDPEDTQLIGLVFLRMYDAESDTILHFGCTNFEMYADVGDLTQFIRDYMKLPKETDVAIYEETGTGTGLNYYILKIDNEQTLIVTKDDWYVVNSTLVFELFDVGSVPQFILQAHPTKSKLI